jgi:hypothetical protein
MGAVYIGDQLELGARGISSNTLSRVLKEMVDERPDQDRRAQGYPLRGSQAMISHSQLTKQVIETSLRLIDENEHGEVDGRWMRSSQKCEVPPHYLSDQMP